MCHPRTTWPGTSDSEKTHVFASLPFTPPHIRLLARKISNNAGGCCVAHLRAAFEQKRLCALRRSVFSLSGRAWCRFTIFSAPVSIFLILGLLSLSSCIQTSVRLHRRSLRPPFFVCSLQPCSCRCSCCSCSCSCSKCCCC